MAEQAHYRWGIIAPITGNSEEMEGAEPLLPPSLEVIQSLLGVNEYDEAGVASAMQRYWVCVDDLVQRGAQRISFAGVPLSSNLGRPYVLELLQETEKRTGIPADGANEAIIGALQYLGAGSVAIASRFADVINERMVAYFAHAGISVPAITTRNHWARESSAESLEAGVKLAVELSREAMRSSPNADAILLPGGRWRALAVVPLLEEDFGIPVITNATARAWRLMHDGLAPAKPGWGRLLANP